MRKDAMSLGQESTSSGRLTWQSLLYNSLTIFGHVWVVLVVAMIVTVVVVFTAAGKRICRIRIQSFSLI